MGRRLSLSLALLSAGWMASLPVQAQSPRPPQALAVLLKQLKAQPLGLYDGMRLLRIPQSDGGSLTISVSCERQLWRVQSRQTPAGRPTFYGDSPFLSATGIDGSWVCTGPARVLE